jgi:hypothetical protein
MSVDVTPTSKKTYVHTCHTEKLKFLWQLLFCCRLIHVSPISSLISIENVMPFSLMH